MASALIVRVVVRTAEMEIVADHLWRLGAIAVGETATGLDAGFDDDERARAAATAMGRRPGLDVDLVADDGAWRDTWRASAVPWRVGRVRVRLPEHDPPDDATTAIDVVVEPGYAFGSGSHPTTRLCIELLQELVGPGSSMLDVGTGTGVLALTAASVGAASVTAIDVDPHAVDVAAANTTRNDMDRVIRVSSTPLGQLSGRYDLVVANLGGAVVLRELARHLCRCTDADGRLILGGLLDGVGALPLDAAWFPGWNIVDRRTLEGWEAIVLAVR